MRRVLSAAACAAALWVSGAAAAAAAPAGKAQAPNSPQIINFSVVEALSAVGARELGGIFSFIPEGRTSMAMAAYLMENRKALKLFVKKVTKDRKEVHGINGWDKEVLLYLVGMGSAPQFESKPVAESWMKRIQELSLEPALPLEVIVQRRTLRK